ncbi:MAG: sulfatase-like hydrolase/transferase, partial [Actinomycetia bacterium]|nr:sulfatase-like hydrolase/transferase [Actinomycetes bacterium]
MTLPRDHPRGPVAAFAQLVLCIGLWLVAGCSADEVSDESAGDGADDLVSGEVEPTSDSTTTTTTIGVSRSQPNILLLIADDYGVESSACYPELALDRAAPTPRLAELCEEGVVFENAWSSPTCSPTRAGMLTGRHSFRTGVGEQETRDNSVSIGPDELTLPRILDSADSGYRHASFGKWHLGGEADNPNVMGWGHFSGLFTGALRDYESWTKTVDGETETVEQYATTETVDDALGWIGTGEDPWLAWVAFNAPHTPFHLPPEELHTATLSGEDTDIEANPGVYYDAAMEALDNEVGRLLDGLSPEVRSNTVIVFVGDNGSPARVSSHQRGQAKGGLYEGGIHVPLAVSGPGIVTERSDALVGTVDIFATVLDMAGIDADHQLASTETDSISFRDVLVGGEG